MKGVFEKKDKFGITAKHTVGFRGFPPMFHPHCEILTVVSGEISARIDGHEITLREGDIATVFPYVVHSYEDAPNAEFYMILFEPEAIGIFENDLMQKKPVYPLMQNGEHLLTIFKKIVEYKNSSNISGLKTSVSYLSALVGELFCSMPLCDVDTTTENMIKPILLYCSEHFTDEDISIKKVADRLYISPSYVSKVFSSKLKYSFREYINELRISKAKKLLSKTDRKIVDVMLECGFKNQSSFNRIFSDICKSSPSEYRQKKRTF